MSLLSRGGAAQAPPSTRFVLALLFLVSFLNFLDRHMLGILLPAIKLELALTDTQLGVVTGAVFGLFYAAMGLPFGYLSDRYPPQRVIACALAFWSAMTAACGMAQGFGQLVTARVLVGVGEAGAMPAANALIAQVVPADRRARALSIYALGLPAGLFVGFWGGGLIAQALGWRAALLTFGVPGLILAVVILIALPAARRPTVGVGLPFGPAIRTLLARPSFVHLCLGSALFTLAWQGMIVWLPSYFTRVYGLPIGEVGAKLALVLASSQAIGLVAGGVAGDLLGKRGARWLLWICAGAPVAALPFFLIAFAGLGENVTLLALLPGFAVGLLQGVPALAALHAVTDPERRGFAVAVQQIIINLIAGLGALLMGLLSDTLSASAGPSALGPAILLIVTPFSIWSATHFWLGSRCVDQDVAFVIAAPTAASSNLGDR